MKIDWSIELMPVVLKLIKNAVRSQRNSARVDRLCIINYHRVLNSYDPLLETEPDVKAFRWQMKLLANYFNVLPLHDAIMALEAGTLPPRAICITFDDGYRSFYDLAFPILKEFHLPATVFVTAGNLAADNMWNDRIIEVLRRYPRKELNLQRIGFGRYPMSSTSERKHAIDKLITESKYLAPTKRWMVVQEIEGFLNGESAPALMLTRNMISTLAREGIEIGGHTISHPILTNLPDELAYHEILENKKALEILTGKPIRYFAYPNGKFRVDFDERHMKMARDAGYIAAFATDLGVASRNAHKYNLPRGRPWDSSPPFFALRLLRWLAGGSN